MVQNEANGSLVFLERFQSRPPRSRLRLSAGVALVLFVCAWGAARSETQAPPVSESPERVRLLGLRREAVGLLERAARQGVSRDEALAALKEAASRLESLGHEPDPAAAPTACPGPGQRRAPGGAPPRRARDPGDCTAERVALRPGPVPRAARARAHPARGRDRARPQPAGQLQPDEGEGAGLRGPCLGDGAGARAGERGRGRERRRALARAVRGGQGPAGQDLLRRTHEGPHPRVGGQRHRTSRLRRRRAPRHLPGHRRRAHEEPRARAAPERPLPQPGRLEIRGRLGEGGRGHRRLGQRRLRGRLRRRREARPLRHRLGLERPLAEPGRRHLQGRGRAGRRPGLRLEHGLHLLRRRRGRGPRPLRRSLREHHLGGRRERAAHARLAQRPAHHGRPGRAARRGRPLLPEPWRRHLRRGFRGGGPRRHREDLRLRRARDRLRRRRKGRPVRGQRLEPEPPLPQPRRRPLRERRAAERASR